MENARSATGSSFGPLLRRWRHLRGKSQMSLALDAGVSARHVGFVETGRARPSREMVLQLATALNVPLRERNAMLLASGFAPVYRETDLDAPELGPARRALGYILDHQEPFPAIVMNRHWDIVRTNDAASRFFSLLIDEPPRGTPNVLRSMFDPRGLRPHVANWLEVAQALIQRVHREAVGGFVDAAAAALLAEVLSYPGVPEHLRSSDLLAPLAPLVPVHFEKGALSMRFFSTVTTLGTPQDITLQELRIECFFPADRETEAQAARLQRDGRRRE